MSCALIDLPEIHTFWIGPSLGPLSVACLRSFLAAGHQVILHVYDEPSDVPKGVTLRDASETLPSDRVIRHKRGSYALFSDIFRYQLLRNGADLYVDCDVYCIRPIRRAEHIFGWHVDNEMNGAVLALPPHSALLNKLIEICEDPGYVPPWLPPAKQWKIKWGMRLGLHPGKQNLPWGSFGPLALTHFAKELGVDHLALPTDVFYPVATWQFSRLFDPNLSIPDLITHRTCCIHLWHEMVRRQQRHIPATSPLGHILGLEEGAQAKTPQLVTL